jgi:hypothetical protein
VVTQGGKVMVAGGAPYHVQPFYLPADINEQLSKPFLIKFISSKKL